MISQQDKEAFQKYAGTEDGSNLLFEGPAFDAWEAAVEYKQKQINNLEIEKQKMFIKMSKELEAEKNKTAKLEEDNKKLIDCVNFYAAGNIQFDYEYVAVQGGLVSKIGSYARKILAKL